jgi:excisionase family DNA binding protein
LYPISVSVGKERANALYLDQTGVFMAVSTQTYDRLVPSRDPIALPIKATLPEGRRALRVKDFCVAYGLSRSTVYKLRDEGKLRLCKIGGRTLIRIEDAEALLNGEG